MLTQAATETMMDHGAVILALYGTWSPTVAQHTGISC